MSNIRKKNIIVELDKSRIVQFKVSSPLIAKKAKPGQFVVVMANERSERVPLTVVDTDEKKESITLIVQEAGFSTKEISRHKAGDSLYSVAGPLGHPAKIKNYGKVILVGGGVGIAEIYPLTKAYKEAGSQITVIIGAKTNSLLILEPELKEAADSFYTITDDGSSGKKGFVTDVLDELISRQKYDLVYAVGPLVMMREVARRTKKQNIETLVSLSVLMVDATGMCGCCRVSVGGETKFTCIDGPEFDAHKIDWQEVLRRNSMYVDKENYICRLDQNDK